MKRWSTRPHLRVKAGRALALLGGVGFSVLHGWSLFWLPAEALPDSIRVITLDGTAIWAWAAIWYLAAGLCLVDLARGHLRWGIALFASTCLVWGLAHVGAWIIAERAANEWAGGVVYLCVAAVVYGMIYKIRALHDMILQARLPATVESDAAAPGEAEEGTDG